MENRTWLVNDNASLQALETADVEEPQQTYRLYRFLTELEDILSGVKEDPKRLVAIAPLVRKLLISSYWLQMEYKEPDPKTGWGVHFLYREFQFPLTIQMVSWSPGTASTVHNHATWGLVAMLGGQEKNRIWRRVPTQENPHKIKLVDEIVLSPGDIITFTPGAIHQVEPYGDEPTISFNLYGVTDFKNRYVFNINDNTAKLF
ncbi:cupin [Oscillatoria sp. CS-180]|uniref:cysteine dioxygenase family protein n=1 Tax=Oscillatoria sp. CS-180 TaxID=3021720 RepID=UPI002330CE10|nr:cupin [Oscillatoria sp. CS-180]MDB9526846.1 cupin [Oscillatoria sp. CS-180]